MQEVLEKRRAEMASRGGKTTEKYVNSTDAQLRAEKLKAGVLKSKKEKEEEEKKRFDELRMQRRERIAARSSPTPGTQSASSTPRAARQIATVPKANTLQKLSSSERVKVGTAGTAGRSAHKAIPGKEGSFEVAAGQRRGQTASENHRRRSVPAVMDMRKENTKPSGRSSLGAKVGVFAPVHAKPSSVHRPKIANGAAPLEANWGVSSRSVARGTVASDDKKRRPVLRKSIATVNDLKAGTNRSSPGSVKNTKDLFPESGTTKSAKKTSTATADAKPFLRKGTGIAPGSGAVLKKPKSSQISDIPKSINEDASDTPSTSSRDGLQSDEEGNKDEVHTTTGESGSSTPALGSSITTEEKARVLTAEEPQDIEDRAGNGPGFVAVLALASTPQETEFVSPPSVESAFLTGALSESSAESGENVNASRPDNEDRKSEPNTNTEEDTLVANEVKVTEVLDSPPVQPTAVPIVEDNQVYEAPHARLSRAESDFPALPLVSGPEDYDAPPGLASPSPSQTSVVPNIEDNVSAFATRAVTIVHDEYETPVAAVTTSPVSSPTSHSFPQLQHSLSPDANQVETSKSRKKWGGSQKSGSPGQQSSKDGPKGFKRLLKLGRRSSKGSAANTSEWVSASTTSEGDDDADERKPSGRRLSDIPKSSKSESNGSSRRGSVPRSFFSLPSFRTKSESKNRA